MYEKKSRFKKERQTGKMGHPAQRNVARSTPFGFWVKMNEITLREGIKIV